MPFSAVLHASQRALCVVGLLGAGLAHAANSYYLTIDGLPGDSKDKLHKNAIDINSFSWGVQNSASGGGGKASFSNFAWTQLADSSTPPLFVRTATGAALRTVTLDVTKSVGGAGSPESFFQLIFTNTYGAALNMSGPGGDVVNVTAAMTSGDTVKMRYRAQDNTGALKPWVEGSFDIKANTAYAIFSGDESVLYGLFQSGGLVNIDLSVVTTVPEPASPALLLAGLAAVGGLALRRQR